ncbi:hypothetical protein DSECCO2_483020 [anaerobic digester metagenome]
MEEDAYDIWFRQAVQEGLDDIEAGRTLSTEEVIANLRRLGARLEPEEDEAINHVRHKRRV